MTALRDDSIHIAHMAGRGRALCGIQGGKLSTADASPLITCLRCRELSSPPDRDEQLRQIAAAAARFNERGERGERGERAYCVRASEPCDTSEVKS